MIDGDGVAVLQVAGLEHSEHLVPPPARRAVHRYPGLGIRPVNGVGRPPEEAQVDLRVPGLLLVVRLPVDLVAEDHVLKVPLQQADHLGQPSQPGGQFIVRIAGVSNPVIPDGVLAGVVEGVGQIDTHPDLDVVLVAEVPEHPGALPVDGIEGVPAVVGAHPVRIGVVVQSRHSHLGPLPHQGLLPVRMQLAVEAVCTPHRVVHRGGIGIAPLCQRRRGDRLPDCRLFAGPQGGESRDRRPARHRIGARRLAAHAGQDEKARKRAGGCEVAAVHDKVRVLVCRRSPRGNSRPRRISAEWH